MAKKQSISRHRIIIRAKKDAAASVVGILNQEPYYIHTNSDSFHAAETHAVRYMLPHLLKLPKIIYQELDNLKTRTEANVDYFIKRLNVNNEEEAIQEIGDLIDNSQTYKFILSIPSQIKGISAGANKAWGDLKKLIKLYETTEGQLTSIFGSDTNISTLLDKIKRYNSVYASLLQQNKYLSDEIKKTVKSSKTKAAKNNEAIIDEETVLSSFTGKDEDKKEKVSKLHGLSIGTINKRLKADLYEATLYEAGLQLMGKLAVNKINNNIAQLVAGDTNRTASDVVILQTGFSVKSTEKIHQEKKNKLDTFFDYNTDLYNADDNLNQGYALLKNENILDLIKYLLLNESNNTLTDYTKELLFTTMAWLSLGEKIFGYNKKNQNTKMTVEDILQEMPAFTYIGKNKEIISMVTFIEQLQKYIGQNWEGVNKVVKHKKLIIPDNKDMIESYNQDKHAVIANIFNKSKDILSKEKEKKIELKYQDIKKDLETGISTEEYQTTHNLKEINDFYKKGLSILIAYEFNWKILKGL